MPKKNSMFYSALLLTGSNLALRMVSMGFQVYLSGQLGAAGVGLLQLTMSVATLAMTAAMAGIRTPRKSARAAGEWIGYCPPAFVTAFCAAWLWLWLFTASRP